MIRNPILPGFNADPSILFADGQYWIATSTFEWWPGVSLYRSTNLKEWSLIGTALNRSTQLELRGVGESCGVWAPHLSRDVTGRFHLAYTIVSNLSDTFFDLKNFMVSAENPAGPWSDPVYLNSRGFDPALFHEGEKTWLCGLDWEFRKGYPHPGVISICEIDRCNGEPLSDHSIIYRGNRRFGCTEGPQIYSRDGWYYLLTAEGGTGYGHAVLVSRSRNIIGPYEESPWNPLLTSRSEIHPTAEDPDPDFLKMRFYNPQAELQKAGHGAIVETPSGETYLAHLCARPRGNHQRCILNRETALQKLEWRDDWPVMATGNPHPRVLVPGIGAREVSHSSEADPDSDATAGVTRPGRDDFDTGQLGPQYHSLRCPIDESWCSLTRRPGRLSLRGRNSLFDRLETTLITRRIQHFRCRIETRMEFRPETPRHMAGLVLMNGPGTWFFLRVYFSETLNSPAIGLMSSANGRPDEALEVRRPLSMEDTQAIWDLRAEIADGALSFYWKPAGDSNGNWRTLADTLDATVLSDEFNATGRGAFSGTFAGLHAVDLDRQESWAHFDFLDYFGITG